MSIQPIFSTFISPYRNVDVDHNSILKDLKKLKYETTGDAGSDMSVEKNIFSKLKKGKQLHKCLLEKARDTIDQLQYDIDAQIVNCWSTRTESGYMSDYHTHQNFWLSAVYYPHGTEEDNYAIRFASERNQDFTQFRPKELEFNSYNATTWTWPIRQGDLIVFPCLLRHKILKHESKNTRYSIACNILPLGTIGDGDGTLTFKKF